MSLIRNAVLASLDSSRLPNPQMLSDAGFCVAIAPDRIDDRDYSTFFSLTDGAGYQYFLDHGQWEQPLTCLLLPDVEALWRKYSQFWFEDCVMSSADLSVFQPGSDRYHFLIAPRHVDFQRVHSHMQQCQAMFNEWIEHGGHSVRAANELRKLYDCYRRFGVN